MKQMTISILSLLLAATLHAADSRTEQRGSPAEGGFSQDAPTAGCASVPGAFAPPNADGDAEHAVPTPSRAGGMANPPAPPRLGEPINDKAVSRYLLAEGTRLVKTGRGLADWRSSLGHKTCPLKLTKPPHRSMPAAEVAARAEKSVVVVGTFFLCDKCTNVHMSTASGAALTSSGVVATSRHVLASCTNNCRGVVVLTRDGRLGLMTEVLACDPLNDLVLIKTDGAQFTPLPVSEEATPGGAAIVVSHPESRFYTVTAGIVSRRSVTRTRDGTIKTLTITADFAKGSSGAPVLDDHGALIGLVNNTQSIYYNMKDNVAENLQMVLKNCTPSEALLALVRRP